MIPLLQIPLFIIFKSRSARISKFLEKNLTKLIRLANLFVMIMSIVFSLFVGIIIEVKKRNGSYNKFFVPSLITICWIIFLLPFIVIIPLVATVLENDSNEFKFFVKSSIIGSAFLLMIGVTLLAIFVNIIFQVQSTLLFDNFNDS